MHQNLRQVKINELQETINSKDNKITLLYSYYLQAKNNWWKKAFEERLYAEFFEYYLLNRDFYKLIKNNSLIKKQTLDNYEKQIKKLVGDLNSSI